MQPSVVAEHDPQGSYSHEVSVSFRLSELVLRTPSLDKLRDWYTLLLGHGPYLERQPDPASGGGKVGGQERASDVRLAFFMVHEDDHPYKQVLAIFEIGDLQVGGRPQAGLHHFQLRLASFDDLAAKYSEFAAHKISPHRAANHGLGTSFYYRDPDGNIVELSCANFATREEERVYATSPKFARNPSGVELDAAEFIANIRAGVSMTELLAVPD